MAKYARFNRGTKPPRESELARIPEAIEQVNEVNTWR
jgi:hypothetical protein